ncbi:mechanosensitive ion channel family protein, partial [Bacteroides ovatus]
LGVTSNMNMEILDTFNKAGLDFAFPTRTVYIQNDESEHESKDTGKAPESKVDSLK